MSAELTISRNRIESFLPMLGAEVTAEGYIRDVDSGELLTTEDGKELTIDEIGYLGSGDDGEIELVEDNFSSIVSYLSDHEEDWDTPE